MRSRTLTTIVASSLLVASCSASDSAEDGDAISVENCGDTVTLDAPPDNVTVLKPAAISTLSELGVLDRVTSRAGQYPTGYYDDATNDTLADIPSITDQLDGSGHLQISREEVVATGADLVLGETDTVNRRTMASSSIPVIEEPALCGDIDGPVTWDDVWDQVELYGTVFDKQDEAASYVADLQQRLDAVPGGDDRDIAVLYPTTGGGVTYAYGSGSMATPLVESVGASNTFHDQTKRVFEVTGEDIVDRNPDVILALYSAGDGEQVRDAVNDLPGIGTTTAGREQRILPMLLNFADPPTPLAVDGAEKLHDYLNGTEGLT
ncbi:MAG: ABC transporter substrate-binding protein [Mycobacteriaceae bacterium]|uniref:ABC transporter substrate-binding protein n=1 Tax=Corynebacterium sp. TaxID=1720 RepID=UPI003F99966F